MNESIFKDIIFINGTDFLNETDNFYSLELEFIKSLDTFFISSFTGLVLSGLGLIILISTMKLFPIWGKKYQNQILLHFMVSRFLNSLCHITTLLIALKFDKDFTYTPLIIMDFFKAYFELVLTMWMLFFTKHLYEMLVVIIIIKMKHKLLKQSVIAWLIPILPSTLYFLASLNSMYICKFIIGIIFKWIITLINCVLFVKIILSVLMNFTHKHQEKKSKVRIVIVFTILFSVISLQNLLMDISGIIALTINPLTPDEEMKFLNILFVLMAIAQYQCFFSICYWIFGNDNGRKLWMSYLSKKFNRQSNNYSGYSLPTTTSQIIIQ